MKNIETENPETLAALSLLNAAAVRERAHRMLAIGLEDRLPNFRVHLAKMDGVIDLVLQITRNTYPSLEVPFHARWRHFVANDADRWAEIAGRARWVDTASRARAEFDLAMVSVFLDAGAGPIWRYRDPKSGLVIGRSEGLGLASLAMFERGTFSADPNDPLRVDADVLAHLTAADLMRGLQISDVNPLVGLDGRVALLRRLGELTLAKPEIFARHDSPRPGGLFDSLMARAENNRLPAPMILSELLRQLGPIWPSRLTLGGIALGDCWRHPSLVTGDATNGLMPLHKLSQWLAYSLIEPLQTSGIDMTEIDGLTGLAEYRNGGLFIDSGVLAFRDPKDGQREHEISSTPVVEWRALTVALLDRLAEGMRERLGCDAVSLPLAKVLQGGSWAAGRGLARERRTDASPPVKVISDGTVF
ncbi:MAG TPA: URC4/urg3 family protein [Bradyrhizobium sp.]|nr:URC4/urg3 family protein [Bradyrhizobium sp.]